MKNVRNVRGKSVTAKEKLPGKNLPEAAGSLGAAWEESNYKWERYTDSQGKQRKRIVGSWGD